MGRWGSESSGDLSWGPTVWECFSTELCGSERVPVISAPNLHGCSIVSSFRPCWKTERKVLRGACLDFVGMLSALRPLGALTPLFCSSAVIVSAEYLGLVGKLEFYGAVPKGISTWAKEALATQPLYTWGNPHNPPWASRSRYAEISLSREPG